MSLIQDKDLKQNPQLKGTLDIWVHKLKTRIND